MGTTRSGGLAAALVVLVVACPASCGNDTASGRGATSPSASTGSTSTIPADADVDLQLRPVLAVLPDGAGPVATTAAGEASTGAPVTLAAKDGTVYDLGSAWLSGAVFDSVDVAESPDGSWRVDPVFRVGPQGIDRFNQLAATCYAATAACPGAAGEHGRIAVVLDGTVLEAPTINNDHFERYQIEISNGFTRAQAEDIDRRLRGA